MPHIDYEPVQRHQWYASPYSLAGDEPRPTKPKDLWREAVCDWNNPDHVQANIGRIQQYAKKCYQIAFDQRFVIWVEVSVVQPGPTMCGVALGESRPYLYSIARGLESWLSAPKTSQTPIPERAATRPESFISRANRLERAGRTDAALDLIYEAVDEMLRTAQFENLNVTIGAVDAKNYSTDIILAILTSTLPARRKLSRRQSLFEKAKDALRERDEDADALLVGLEP